MNATETMSKYDEIKENPELLAEFLISNYKKNIQTLKKYYPEIASKFENYTPQKSIDFFASPNGVPNFQFTEDEYDFYRQKISIKFNNYLSLLHATPFSETKTNTDCPLEFSKYLVNNILEHQVTFVTPKKEYDSHGQIHFKYINRIAEVIDKVIEKKICKVSDAGLLTLFVSVGIGLGYHLHELSSKIEILNSILIEPDPDVFFASLHCFCWTSYIERTINEGKTLTILINDDPETLGRQFFSFMIQKGIYMMSGGYFFNIYDDPLSHEISTALFNKYYYSLPSAYGFIDDRIFGISHTCYSILKKRNFVLNKPLKKEYQNYPVFIIGSGPSLDQDLAFLKKNQDKAIIIACGTAIDSLYHAGIMPDFYANTERTPQVSQALEIIPDKDFLKQIPLLCSCVCHPYVINHFPKTAIFGKWDENFTDYLAANLDKTNNFTNIQTIKYMNPLVGNMGISGAITLGFKNIYLFGIDNGKKVNSEKMHSALTSLYTNSGTSDKNGNYVLQKIVKGNFDAPCETNDIYIKSINTIEQSLLEKNNEQDFSCVNCSDGAFIKYTKPLRSTALEERFNNYKEIDKKEFFNYFFKEKTKSFDISKEQLKKIFHPELLNNIYDNIIDMIRKTKKNHKDYLKLCNEINLFLSTIRANISTFFSRTAESSFNNMLVVFVTALYCEDKKVGKMAAEEILEIIVDFLTEAKELYSKLPDYTLNEHRKYYPDGKVGRDMPHCKAPTFPPILNIIGVNYDDPVKKFVKKYN